MGNRAVITMAKKPTENSVGIYLHWNGGPESVLAFAEAAKHFGVRFHDETYGMARLSQIIGNFFGGTLSVGVGTLRQLDCHNYDNGTYRLSMEGEEIVLEQSEDGKNGWERLDNARIRKHKYWESNDEQNGNLADIIEKNQHAYPKPERQKV